MTKLFKIVRISTNANSFGLHGHVLVARDGTAFEVGRGRGPWNTGWKLNQEIAVPYITDEGSPCRPCWASVACEIPHELPACPANVLKEIFDATVGSPTPITKSQFAAICGEYLIDIGVALENENVAAALKAGDVAKLRNVLQTEF